MITAHEHGEAFTKFWAEHDSLPLDQQPLYCTRFREQFGIEFYNDWLASRVE